MPAAPESSVVGELNVGSAFCTGSNIACSGRQSTALAKLVEQRIAADRQSVKGPATVLVRVLLNAKRAPASHALTYENNE